MTSLYEYIGDYKMLQDLIDDETVTYEQVAEALSVIEGNIETKFQNISWLIKEYQGKSEMFKKEEKRLNERRKSFDNKVDGLKQYLIESLDAIGKTKIEAGTFTVRKQKNPKSVAIHDAERLPEKYLIQQEAKVDGTLLKEDVVKNGLNVAGAGVAPETYHIRIQ